MSWRNVLTSLDLGKIMKKSCREVVSISFDLVKFWNLKESRIHLWGTDTIWEV